MAKKTQRVYICTSCGGSAPRWQGQCPECGQWNSLQERTRSKGPVQAVSPEQARPVSLTETSESRSQMVPSGIQGLDEVLGGGVNPGAVILLGGEPGIGKSTLLLQLCSRLAQAGRKTVYVSGEESLHQLRGRAERINALQPGLLAMSSVQADPLLSLLEDDPPQLLVIDSVQTLASSQLEGLPGSVSQVRAVTSMLSEKAKQVGTALVLVGHVTKEGQIAGPKLLEHMVDTVLYLEGDREHLFRMLRVIKNRYGPSNELLVLQMESKGLVPVLDPSTLFLQRRNPGLSGTAVVMTMDSNRPFAVEVQALATKSYLAVPRRTALGFDLSRLNLLLAVMEKHLRLQVGQMDVYAKVGGGLRLQEPGFDAGLVAAVLSSIYDRPLPEGVVLWGEVDLNGQIRPVFGEETRLKQAQKLGYVPTMYAKAQETVTLTDLQQRLFKTG